MASFLQASLFDAPLMPAAASIWGTPPTVAWNMPAAPTSPLGVGTGMGVGSRAGWEAHTAMDEPHSMAAATIGPSGIPGPAPRVPAPPPSGTPGASRSGAEVLPVPPPAPVLPHAWTSASSVRLDLSSSDLGASGTLQLLLPTNETADLSRRLMAGHALLHRLYESSDTSVQHRRLAGAAQLRSSCRFAAAAGQSLAQSQLLGASMWGTGLGASSHHSAVAQDDRGVTAAGPSPSHRAYSDNLAGPSQSILPPSGLGPQLGQYMHGGVGTFAQAPIAGHAAQHFNPYHASPMHHANSFIPRQFNPQGCPVSALGQGGVRASSPSHEHHFW
ncbi:hypothetical protein V8C86DRAFT_2644631 [Haematococcus lacustris]